jgi:type IV secretion system protein VirB10
MDPAGLHPERSEDPQLMSTEAGELPEELRGERKIPGLNAKKPKSGLRGALWFGLLLIGLVGLGGAYAWWAKNLKAEETTAPKKEAERAPVEEKEFGEAPPEPPPPPPELSEDGSLEVVPAIETVDAKGTKGAAAPPTYPVQQSESGPARQVLDKSAAALMIGSAGGSGATGNAAAGEGGFDPRVAAMIAEATGPAAAGGNDEGGMAELLKGSRPAKRKAYAMGNRNFLLSAGTFIDCANVTRIDSTVAGQLICQVTRDVFSDNGKTVLVERGSRMTGEYMNALQQGQNRLFVVWTTLRTPFGIEVPLDSPGTDPLGGAGLPGKVKTHFWKRFGAAILVSIVDDAGKYATSRRSGGGQTNVNLGSTQDAAGDMAKSVLEKTIDIPPTLYKNHGDRINIIVARDIDFGDVYDLAAQ